MTYYLKYRPNTLEELDQEPVRNTLTKIFSSSNIPHAFLFSGPRGTGKTSASRIIAKILNCENVGKTGEPCNDCGQCLSITKGDSLDVIELDAASHRGIDDVRQIKEAVKLAPVNSKKKVYIIDEAHMLTTEASNALLKTLEEPPSHVVFILATTNPEKLIETVRSRLTNIRFTKASDKEIERSLSRIVKAEKLKISSDALSLIAKRADGSFRDAAKTLEQIVSELEDFSVDAVSEFLFNTKKFNVNDFFQKLKNRNTKEALLLMQNAIELGMGAKEVIRIIVQSLRLQLLSLVGIGEIDDSEKIFKKDELIKLIELFSDSSAKLPTAYIEEIPLELAVIKWCESEERDPENIPVKKKLTVSESVSEKIEILTKRASSDDADNSTKNSATASNGGVRHSEATEPLTSEKETLIPIQKEIDTDFWAKILMAIKPASASTEALLRAAKPIGFEGNTLKLGVFYKFHKEHLESNQHRLVLEKAIGSLTGESGIRVVCELTDPPVRKTYTDVLTTNHDVILTEPPPAEIPNSTLTNGKSEDIIDLAEKLFSN